MVHLRNSEPPFPGPRSVKLAPGIVLTPEGESSAALLLSSSEGKVRLNRQARLILELCDGSRTRDRVVVDAMLRCAGAMRAADVIEFLAAARARGWVMETG